jgi:hypothetical protein
MQARGYRPKFIGADGRPGRVGVERDDGGPFGPPFRSVLLAQEGVWRQETPSESTMRRTWLRLLWMPEARAASVKASNVQ